MDLAAYKGIGDGYRAQIAAMSAQEWAQQEQLDKQFDWAAIKKMVN